MPLLSDQQQEQAGQVRSRKNIPPRTFEKERERTRPLQGQRLYIVMSGFKDQKYLLMNKLSNIQHSAVRNQSRHNVILIRQIK